jgi:hypothetical protein
MKLHVAYLKIIKLYLNSAYLVYGVDKVVELAEL